LLSNFARLAKELSPDNLIVAYFSGVPSCFKLA